MSVQTDPERMDEPGTRVRLAQMDHAGYQPGRGLLVRSIWLLVDLLVFRPPVVTSYRFKRSLLRLFGARIGSGVLIKPSVQIKHPWRLAVGDDAWIGEHAWIDNLVEVTLGSNSVISQGAYLCTGNHDWSDPKMSMRPAAIVVEDGAWVAAFARVGPGVRVGREAIVGLGAVLLEDADAGGIYAGNPARRIGGRKLEGGAR